MAKGMKPRRGDIESVTMSPLARLATCFDRQLPGAYATRRSAAAACAAFQAGLKALSALFATPIAEPLGVPPLMV
jgi:hypothetical protein